MLSIQQGKYLSSFAASKKIYVTLTKRNQQYIRAVGFALE